MAIEPRAKDFSITPKLLNEMRQFPYFLRRRGSWKLYLTQTKKILQKSVATLLLKVALLLPEWSIPNEVKGLMTPEWRWFYVFHRFCFARPTIK